MNSNFITLKTAIINLETKIVIYENKKYAI